jgi:pyrimidine-specific ribonucleoside hydrolase
MMNDDCQPILIDCDTGIDDCYALVLALRASSRLRVVGVTTVVGNVSLAQVTRNTAAVLHLCGASPHDTPLAAGMAEALLEPAHPCPQIHGADGLGDLGLAAAHAERYAVDPRHACQLISDCARRYAGELTLVATAPLTNVAVAMRLDPLLRTRLRRIVLMGGAARVGGNQRAWAEANVGDDPEAAHIVFTSGVDIVMYPWDVFERFSFPRADAERFAAAHDPAARLVGQVMLSEINRFQLPAASMGDAGTIVYLLEPTAATTERRHVAIELAGAHTRGMTVVDLRPRVYEPDEPQRDANVTLITHIDVDRFRAVFNRYIR